MHITYILALSFVSSARQISLALSIYVHISWYIGITYMGPVLLSVMGWLR